MENKAKNRLSELAVIFVVGGMAGVIGCQVFLPWLGGIPIFNKIAWLREIREGVTIINKTERIVVTENEAFEQAIDKAQNIVVMVTAQKTEKIVGGKKVALAKAEILAQGSGFIVSSDGLVVTADNLVPETAQKIAVSFGGKEATAEIRKRDKNSGLALLKINENNLPVLPFLEQNVKLGERLFLVGAKNTVLANGQNQVSKFTDLSLAKQTSPALAIDFLGKDSNGSPIFSVKSEIIGMNLVDASGQGKIVVVSQIRDLMK
ncbi:MAG: serine protease [bacterium]